MQGLIQTNEFIETGKLITQTNNKVTRCCSTETMQTQNNEIDRGGEFNVEKLRGVNDYCLKSRNLRAYFATTQQEHHYSLMKAQPK